MSYWARYFVVLMCFFFMNSELLLVQWFYKYWCVACCVCVGEGGGRWGWVVVVDVDKFKMHDCCSFHDFHAL